ncbi:MAG: hypothetical protein QM756_38350 [Polyangiaceae bacterium]
MALGGCSFLLDFDELQKGKAGAGGQASGGSANSGGKAGGGVGGAEGGAGGACECTDADSDPCTVARCIDNVCTQVPIQGLVLERDFDPIVAERHYQLSMVAGPSDFYLSSLSTTAGVPDATIYRLTATSTTVAPAAQLNSLKLAGQPLSAPALALDTTSGIKIHSYVALKDASGVNARVWHVVFDSDFKVTLRVPVSTTYAIAPSLAAQSLHPAALTIGTDTWGAWVNADGSVSAMSTGLNPETLQFGAPTTPASSVALLGTRANRPTVLYTVDGGGVYLQSEAGSVQLSECQTGAGVYYGSYAAPTSFAGLWAIGWTKSGTSFLTSEGGLGMCANNGSCLSDSTCDTSEANNYTRNPGVASQHIQGDAVGVVYYLEVLPTLIPTTTASFQASASAWLFRIDFGSNPNLSGVQAPTAVGDPVLLTTQATSAAAGYRGPDHAAAAIIGDVAAVAWVEPTPDANDQIRVQRYKMCLPR